MTSQLKTYFLPPNWDFAPGGLITLGSIIIDLKRPDRSLNVGAQVGIPLGEISRDRKEGWQRTGEWLREQDIRAQTPQLSILELFLQVVAHANAVDNTESDEVYKCDVLETECFQPTERYIRRCLQNPMVTSYIRDNRYRLPVYMITA
ncbi:hypothetical protein BKA61DRAFT_719678 [Leptodontidium sp. MPI-SDFR-AT-0119]|nr:hypothetical protein BKA61DRAFT_719678 [Leptodontidium sp. MPI-SDFR-AT-0119]